jgi:hypothetical protein
MGEKSAASVMKEQFALIGMLVVLIGTVYTDSYYSGFGLRYQSLGLPASHILYRGITAVVDMPFLAIPYLVGIGWLTFASLQKVDDRALFPIWTGYLSIVFILAITYPLATYAGTRAAKRDLGTGSKLPRIERLLPKDAASDSSCNTPAVCRLLLVDTDYLYVFVPQDAPDVPHVKRLNRKVFDEIDTGTQ